MFLIKSNGFKSLTYALKVKFSTGRNVWVISLKTIFYAVFPQTRLLTITQAR